MTEEIIIDGIDVAGCQCFATAHVVMTASGILVKDIDNACTVKQKPCEEIKDCMFKRQFKQLKRLEQENKELKEDVLKWQKEFSRQYQINENKGYSKTEENYRSALEEIREIVASVFAKQRPYKEDFTEIETIINEVLS